MGSFVSSIIAKASFDCALLEALPKSVGFRVYAHARQNCFPIDFYSTRRGTAFPFSQQAPGVDYPSAFPAEVPQLVPLYEGLRKNHQAHCLNPSFLHLCNHVSLILGQPVLGIAGDDDGLDLSCVAEAGRLQKIVAGCGGGLLNYDKKNGAWIEMFLEEEESEGRPDTGGLKCVEVPVEKPLLIHHYCIRSFLDFTGAATPILGLGEFDTLDDEKNWVLQYDSKRT